MWLNIGCGPFSAPAPWVNTDVVRIHGLIEPDILVESPWPAELVKHGILNGSVERVYLGHVLEHVSWTYVHEFMQQLKQLCAPGAEVVVVGPDSKKVIEAFRTGDSLLDDVMAIIEDDLHYQNAPTQWDGARHCWNCYEERIVRMMTNCGLEGVEAVPMDQDSLAGWPVVSFAPFQCAAKGRVPKNP